MKTRIKFYFVSVCFLFLLTSCLDSEKEYLFIDLQNKTGELRYSNIVSDATDEKSVKEDFQQLITLVYQDEDIKKEPHSEPIETISKEIYRNGEQLDGKVKFSFKELREALKEFKIQTDENGDYIYVLGPDDIYIRANGKYIEHNSTRLVKWNNRSEKIELETKSGQFDKTKKVSLLSNWLDWKNKNLKQ